MSYKFKRVFKILYRLAKELLHLFLNGEKTEKSILLVIRYWLIYSTPVFLVGLAFN